jgi:DNA-binding NarL/FixJ family response regulator
VDVGGGGPGAGARHRWPPALRRCPAEFWRLAGTARRRGLRAAAEDFVNAVRTVHNGESLLFPAAIRRLVAQHGGHGDGRVAAANLTGRESEVLRLVAQGLSNAEIAGQLFLGVETVKTHVRNVLAKLGARDRVQAVIGAYESGFIR